MSEVDVYEGPVQVTQSSPTGLASEAAREGAMLESMFLMSQKVPRNIGAAIDNAIALATLDKESAEACFYAFKRGGKMIVGPSIRMAEIMHQCWGRLFVTTRQVAVSGKVVVTEGRAIDLVSLACASTEASRRITKSDGSRYDDDMIAVTSNAAQSIARRNAIFALIPVPLRKKVEDAARKCAHGDVKSLTERRTIAMQKLGKLGISQERIFAAVERQSLDEITPDDLIVLASLYTQIMEEGKDADYLFPDPDAVQPVKPGATGIGLGAITAADVEPQATTGNHVEISLDTGDSAPSQAEGGRAEPPLAAAAATPAAGAARTTTTASNGAPKARRL